MTVGKSDPTTGRRWKRSETASAAVSGTNPVSGQPYAPGYAGLPTEMLGTAETPGRQLRRRPKKSRYLVIRNSDSRKSRNTHRGRQAVHSG